jgi:hypothetical protein
VGVVVALAAGEAAARVFAPSWLVRRMDDLRTGGRADDARSDRTWPTVRDADGRFAYFKPGGHAVVATDEFDHELNFDELGGRRTVLPGGADAPVVGATGDSFTFGVGVADGETYLSLLAPKAGVRFVNLGVPGSALPQQLDLIERRHAAIGAPRVYLFGFYTGNDLNDIVNFERELHQQPLLVTSSPAVGAIRRVNAWITRQSLLSRSYLVQWTRAGIVMIYNARQTVPLIDSAILPMTGNDAYWAEARPGLRRALDRLVEVSTRLHIVPIVVLLPDRLQVDAAARESRIRAYGYKDNDIEVAAVNRVVSAELGGRGVKTIDLLDCLKNGRGLYYVRDIHLTPEGQRRVAACLESAALPAMIREALGPRTARGAGG